MSLYIVRDSLIIHYHTFTIFHIAISVYYTKLVFFLNSPISHIFLFICTMACMHVGYVGLYQFAIFLLSIHMFTINVPLEYRVSEGRILCIYIAGTNDSYVRLGVDL